MKEAAKKRRPPRSKLERFWLRLFGTVEGDDASCHALVRPIGHHAPRRQYDQSLTVQLKSSHLFGADPLGIPSHLDTGRPLVSFGGVGAGIGDECAQQLRPFLIGLCGFAGLSCQYEEYAPLWRES